MRTLSARHHAYVAVVLATAFAACSEPTTVPSSLSLGAATADKSPSSENQSEARRQGRVQCDADNGGITWPVTATYAAVFGLAAVANIQLVRSRRTLLTDHEQ